MQSKIIMGLSLLISGCALTTENLQQFRPDSYPPEIGFIYPTADTSATGKARLQTTETESPRFADLKPTEYVLVRADAVGVTNAADDEKNTYIGFRSAAPEGLLLFDSEGRKLKACTSGRVIGIKGVHDGILLRNHDQNSYVAKNPDSPAVSDYPLSDDPDIVAVQNEIVMMSRQLEAFEKAIRKADQSTSASKTTPSQSSTLVQSVANPPPNVVPPGPDDTYGVLPDGTVLIRVFFEFGSEIVVRPADGLIRLESEAKEARTVMLIGYTDSVGTTELNQTLAKIRVNTIADHLVSVGVPRQKISVHSAGETEFLASNRTWRGRATNRRVEALLTPYVASR